jgi:hypothetical protein
LLKIFIPDSVIAHLLNSKCCKFGQALTTL